MDKRIRLILASASPRRRELLRKLKIPFRVIPSHVPESSSHKNPIGLVKDLALRKAKAVARTLPLTLMPSPRGEGRVRGPFVLGADTVVVLHRRILGKPRDARDACRMLGRLSGSTHEVYTGVALVDAKTQKAVVAYAQSRVRMKKIPLDERLRLARQHLDKAGAYAIQEKRDPIARVVRGSYDNVVGLPVALVKRLLASFPRQIYSPF